MKTYSIGEAFEMLDENENLEFKARACFDCEGKHSILKITSDGYYTITNYNKNGKEEEGVRKEFNGMISKCLKWELIQKPVSYAEVLYSNKKCRVEHELLNKDYFLNNDEVNIKEFNNFDEVMWLISKYLSAQELRQVMKEGKWYIEQ